MPRLLFLTERFPPDIGGVAISAARTARALTSLGLDVEVVSWSRMVPPGEVQSGHSDGLSVHRIGRYRQWDTTLLHTMNVLDWLRRRSVDAVWGHYLFPGGFVAAWLGGQHKIPSVVSVRGNDVERDLYPPGDFARLEWTLRKATLVTAVTRDLARKVAAISDREDTYVLANAVDLSVFAPGPPDLSLRNRLGILAEECVLAFSGELREKKGARFLLDALAAVRQRRPACLLVIGEVRPSQASVLQHFVELDPAAHHRVIVTGHLPEPADVAAHLRLCDLFLLPSLWEGMPNALLEAMATERVCIASDAGGIPEVITHGVDGFILPRWQLDHLGTAALEWLDRESKPEIGKAARLRVQAEFSPQRERERLHEAFRPLNLL